MLPSCGQIVKCRGMENLNQDKVKRAGSVFFLHMFSEELSVYGIKLSFQKEKREKKRKKNKEKKEGNKKTYKKNPQKQQNNFPKNGLIYLFPPSWSLLLPPEQEAIPPSTAPYINNRIRIFS